VFCLIPRDQQPKLILTNSAYETAKKHTWIEDIRTYKTGVYIVRPESKVIRDGKAAIEEEKSAIEVLNETLKEVNPKRLAIEKDYVSISLYEKIKKILPDTEFVDATPIFKELRMIKTDEEIKRFKEATRILDKAIMKVIKCIDKGVSEIELYRVFKKTVLEEGGDSWQQTTIAIGPQNGPDIFNQPSERKVMEGDVIRIDASCVYKGYTADNARTIVFRKVPDEARKIYAAVKEATDRGIAAMKPGVKVCEIHKIIRDVVRQKYDPNYTRGNVGHGVGVELYDEPEITIDNMQELLPGMTISVEAPYHKFGLGGFIVEDSILITEDGYENVSTISRELFII
jgi:Xaa-Pro dipeptidase